MQLVCYLTLDLCIQDISHKRNYTTYGRLCLISWPDNSACCSICVLSWSGLHFFSFYGWVNFSIWIYYIVHSALDGYLYCFCVGLFHGTAVNTYVQGFLWTYVFILLSRPESSITRPHGTSHFNFLENGWYVSQSSYTTLEFPLSTGSNFSISSATFFCYFLKC